MNKPTDTQREKDATRRYRKFSTFRGYLVWHIDASRRGEKMNKKLVQWAIDDQQTKDAEEKRSIKKNLNRWVQGIQTHIDQRRAIKHALRMYDKFHSRDSGEPEIEKGQRTE